MVNLRLNWCVLCMTLQTSKRLIKTQETQINNILLANTAFEFPVVVTSNLIYTFFLIFREQSDKT